MTFHSRSEDADKCVTTHRYWYDFIAGGRESEKLIEAFKYVVPRSVNLSFAKPHYPYNIYQKDITKGSNSFGAKIEFCIKDTVCTLRNIPSTNGNTESTRAKLFNKLSYHLLGWDHKESPQITLPPTTVRIVMSSSKNYGTILCNVLTRRDKYMCDNMEEAGIYWDCFSSSDRYTEIWAHPHQLDGENCLGSWEDQLNTACKIPNASIIVGSVLRYLQFGNSSDSAGKSGIAYLFNHEVPLNRAMIEAMTSGDELFHPNKINDGVNGEWSDDLPPRPISDDYEEYQVVRY